MSASSTTLQVLNAADVLARLHALRERQPVAFAAFYSSQLGGIVTDPALMVMPFDDHMVHRGHGIFDTAGLVGGKIYDLEAHLDRFLKSAERSKLRLPGTRDEMRAIIVQTTAASGRRDGAIRYWLSSGPGSLELSPAAGAEPGFFVMVFPGLAYPERWYTDGLQGDDHDLPDQAAALRHHQDDQLPAQRADADGGQGGRRRQRRVHRRQRARRRELEHERGVRDRRRRARHPRFDHILSGCTALRMLELARGLVGQGVVSGVEVGDIPVADARAAREMLLIGSSVRVAPIVQWDGQPIGDGRPGPIAKALLAVLDEDMRTGDRLIPVRTSPEPPRDARAARVPRRPARSGVHPGRPRSAADRLSA